jgi:hypothetical protein
LDILVQALILQFVLQHEEMALTHMMKVETTTIKIQVMVEAALEKSKQDIHETLVILQYEMQYEVMG